MRRAFLPGVLVCSFLGAAAHADVAAGRPRVGYRTEATVGNWQPIDVADLARTIEGTALEALSGSGDFIFEKWSADSDFVLDLRSRVLDEAETHTVIVSFSPGKKDGLPSVRASDTVVLSRLDRKQIVKTIVASTRKAAREVLEALAPALRGGPLATGPEIPDRPLPWQWPELRLSPVAPAALAELMSQNQTVAQRALRVTTAAADGPARRKLEHCALHHALPDQRRGCLIGLGRAARVDPRSQRVVVEVYRRDQDSRVREQAAETMGFFAGAARDEAVQAWLERTASGQPEGLLQGLGDVPNLDAAIRGCLLAIGKRVRHERERSGCIELVEPLSFPRRYALLMPFLRTLDPRSPAFLEGAGEREGSIGTDWQRAMEAVLERARAWDAEYEAILWTRYKKLLSSFALDALVDWAAPSAGLADGLLEVVRTAGTRRALQGLRRVVEAEPALGPRVAEKLSELVVTGEYPKTISEDALQELIKFCQRGRR